MGDQPHRIQRARTKGWKMPPDAIYVGRPSRWGNPFVLHDYRGAFRAVLYFGERGDRAGRRAAAVKMYRLVLTGERIPKPVDDRDEMARLFMTVTIPPDFPTPADVIRELRGKNLACWCRPGEPCHADVLLEIANG